MIENHQNKILTPSAIAIKTNNYDGEHLIVKGLSQVEIKIGNDALKYLKIHPDSGAPFLPRIIGRSFSTEFEIPKILNATEFLSILLHKIYERCKTTNIEGVAITVHDYFTISQRKSIIQAVSISKIPLINILDETSAIIQFYAIRFSKKFIYDTHRVLFVDVGASGIRSYRVEFKLDGNNPIGTQTTYEWSEKTGGISFIRKVAEKENCSISKAQKLLINNGDSYEELLCDDLDEIYRVVESSLDDEIDEVQLIGGVTLFPFIKRYIQKVVGYIDVYWDLPQMESVALGSIYLLQSSLNESQYPMIPLTKPPIYTSSCKCGKSEFEYCNHRKGCQEYIVFQDFNCTKIFITANKKEIPEGAGNIIGSYTLKNITKRRNDDNKVRNLLLIMQSPSPVIRSALMCKGNSRNCLQVEYEMQSLYDRMYETKKLNVNKIIQIEEERNRKNELKSKLSLIVENMNKVEIYNDEVMEKAKKNNFGRK